MRLSQVVGGFVLAGLGAGIGAWVHSKFQEVKFQEVKPFQVTGDPPVTVSDGSLHAHSGNGWVADYDGDTTIQPKPKSGTLGTSCKMIDSHGNPTATSLWADDKIYDISPGATITIVHDPADKSAAAAAQAAVTIQVPNGTGDLTITTAKGSFYAGKGTRHNREHTRPGEVASITINNPRASPVTWTPVNPDNPHFTLLFCYQ
jgi:hypothetical protein